MIQAIELAQFYGTEGYTRGHMNVLMTDGVNYLTQYGASWLVTDATVIVKQKLAQHEFVMIEALVDENNTARVIYSDGNDNILHKQIYEYTDLSCNVKMYYTNNVMMLAGEY